MYEICFRFTLKKIFELLIEAKAAEIILAEFGASIEVIC